jgi:hypothetical protein
MASMNKPAADDTDWTTDYTDNWTSIENNLIDKATAQARGDILAATGASSPVRVPVGANDDVLKADSTASAGVAWGRIASAALMRSSSVSATNSVPAQQEVLSQMPDMTLKVSVGAPGKVLAIFSADLQTNNARGVVRLKRDGTVLRQMALDPGGNTTYSASIVTLDECGIGTFTYTIDWIQNYNFNSFTVNTRKLIVIKVPA